MYSLVVFWGTAVPSELTQPVKGAADDGLIFYPTGPSFDSSPPSCAPVRTLRLILHVSLPECRVVRPMQQLQRCWLCQPCSCLVLRLPAMLVADASDD